MMLGSSLCNRKNQWVGWGCLHSLNYTISVVVFSRFPVPSNRILKSCFSVDLHLSRRNTLYCLVTCCGPVVPWNIL